MSISDDLRRMADRVTELERSIETLEDEAARLGKENDEQCDTIFVLGQTRGLSEQARIALELAARYLAEGDDIATSQRLQDALLQAVASASEAREAA